MSAKRTPRIAIVGTGPAGMYAVEHLLEDRDVDVEIDLYDRLPTPWGLVRGGVAPDHPEKKLVVDRLFDYFFKLDKVRYFGNVEIGRDIQADELAEWYDAVIYAIGATSNTELGIPGESLPGCWAAQEFVAWYNGHPDFSELEFDLTNERAVIVGNGNVALDVARILAAPIEVLEKTDIADHALSALRNSAIKEVVILGRRGHWQAAYNNPELEELEHLDGVEVVVETNESGETGASVAGWEDGLKVETLQRLAERKVQNPVRRIVFRFLASPVEIVGGDKVESVRVVRNSLQANGQGRVTATATADESLLETGLVLKSIGYRGEAIPGLPFDDKRGVIENQDGRVSPGVYVTGWIKRGPRGVIGTNKKCARDTVHCLLEDMRNDRLTAGSLDADAISEQVSARQSNVISRQDWLRIDHAERIAGRQQGRPRVKFTNVDEMLASAGRN